MWPGGCGKGFAGVVTPHFQAEIAMPVAKKASRACRNKGFSVHEKCFWT